MCVCYSNGYDILIYLDISIKRNFGVQFFLNFKGSHSSLNTVWSDIEPYEISFKKEVLIWTASNLNHGH